MPVKLIASLLLCLLLGACSTKMAYNYLDWILEWYVGDLVSLSEDQEWQFRNALARQLDWHRKKQLPLYVKSLDDLHNAIDNEFTVEVLQRIYNEQENGLNELIWQITPTLSELLATLSDSQVEQLIENLEEQNQELEEEYVKKSRDELVAQRAERMVDRAENWVGTLNESQTQLITNWSRQIRPTAEQWIANRRAWQAKLDSSLRQKRHTADFNKYVEDLFVNSDKTWPDSYRADFEINRNLVFNMLVNLENTLSDRQRQHLFEEIAVLRKQLTELHQQN
jgi:hypothetical protein